VLELRRDDAGARLSPLTPRIALLLVLPPLLWAGNAVVGRLLVGAVPPLGLNFVRWLLTAVLLLPLGWHALREPGALRGRVAYLALLGLLGVGSYNSLQYLALHSSSPLNVTLIAASAPVWMLAIGAIVYRERPRGREIAGAVLSLTGVALVLSRGEPAALAALRFVVGDLLMLVAIACWCFYSWLLARPPEAMQGAQRPSWNWAEFLLLQALFGLLWSSVATGTEALVSDAQWRLAPGVVAMLLYVAVGPSVIAYRCWGIGVSTVGPAIAAFFANLTPLFAALLSAAVLGEPPRAYHALSFVLILGGIAVSSRR
jgi:drug/metabolite transporter (DMT)-like permease